MAELLLQMKNIHKKFPGVYALKNVDFDLKSGEVHALLGENGAGKSTLIKVLGGIYRAEEGKIVIQGKETLINSVADARETGISIIHQEIMLVPNMTIAENIFMGREPTTRLGGVNYRRMNTEAQALIDGFGMNIDASRKVATLSIAQQQMVEIVKAISAKAKIVVMDEPTSSLTDTEVEHLFALIKQLKAQNIGIIYISHKLEELFRICDRITVMRDGERVGTVSTEKTNRNELIKMMVGRTLDEYYIHTERPLGDRVLEAKHIRGKSVKDGSFFLRKGEILGFAGLIGSGRSELMKSMIGIEKRTGGEVYVGGKPVMLNGISDALKVGVALVPEDRKKEGLVLKNSVGFNLTLAVLGEFIRGIHVDRSKEEKIIDQYVRTLQRNPLFPVFVINELQRDPEHIYHSILKNPARVEPIIRMRKQMEDEMERGVLKKLPVYYAATTLISLLVFPMLVRNPFTAVFMGGDAEKYEEFLRERIPFVIDIMIRLLTPDDNTSN